jgi:putative FmdB family regulatory protein
MTMYLFRCPTHGDIEVVHPIEEPHPKYCPACGSEIKRVWSPTTAKFLGEGWTGARMNTMNDVKTEPTSPESTTPYE